MNLWREAMLVAGKDLRIEARSRVTLYQVLPFGLIVVLLFAFALDPSRGVLARVAPGLFWVAVLLAALLAVSRSFQVEMLACGLLVVLAAVVYGVVRFTRQPLPPADDRAVDAARRPAVSDRAFDAVLAPGLRWSKNPIGGRDAHGVLGGRPQ